MIDKELVKDNFSQAANSYEDYAVVQEYMGQELANMIKDRKYAANILELGAGTGLFTEKLLDDFSDSNILLVDLAQAMIEQCQDKFSSYDNINYLVTDAERINLKQSFDLIVSNATVQWFHDLKLALQRFKSHLKDEGAIYFSTFGTEHFRELTNCCNQILEDNYSQDFYSKEEVKSILKSDFSEVKVREEEYREEFSTVRDFLLATKKIGANSAKKNKPQLTPTKLRQLENLYRKQYSSDNQIIVTHHLLFVKLST